MDVKIDNKDIVLKPCGDAKYISSFDEVLQRVKIACSIQKGSFVYDTSFGSVTQGLSFDDELLKEKLEMIFNEATIGIGCDSIEVCDIDKEKKTAIIKVECSDLCDTVEVQING